MRINPVQNRRLHALLTDLRLMDAKKDLVSSFTHGRTDHSSEMSYSEAEMLIRHLDGEKDQRTKKMRAKIIHLLCLYGMTNEKGDPDYERINAFIRNIGTRNPKKKNLLYLNATETHNVLCQVEVMIKKELQR